MLLSTGLVADLFLCPSGGIQEPWVSDTLFLLQRWSEVTCGFPVERMDTLPPNVGEESCPGAVPAKVIEGGGRQLPPSGG